MIQKIILYFKTHIKKSQIIVFLVGLFFLLVGFLSWTFYFSRFEQFENQEKMFLDAVKNYYEYHTNYLPQNGMIRKYTLGELYEENRIEELLVPGSNELCSLDSWVKVYNDNGNYVYHTYLDCGKYQSKVDHVGPTITLKGDSTIYISLNHDYEELGVESVSDDTDEMSIEDVTIDSSLVSTSKIGKYNVTYTARDSLQNETKVVRTVYVARNLSDVVKESTNDTNYYQGNVDNNYLLFSGMLYRIVKVNDDKTVLIISNENVSNLRVTSSTYENSNFDSYLQNVYQPIIYNDNYVVEKEYCVGEITSFDDVSSSCSTKVTRKVALLSIDDYKNTFVGSASYLCTNFSYALANSIENENVNSFAYSTSGNCLTSLEMNQMPSIRPALTLKENLVILSGTGTKDNPYKLNDYSYGRQQAFINTRLIGEYVNYSGEVFRIMDIQDGNVTLIATDGLIKNVSSTSETEYLTLTVPTDDDYTFSVDSKNNPGYIMNHDYLDYLNDSYILNASYTIPVNEENKNYQDYTSNSLTTKIILPKTYDLFSGVQSNNSGYMYLYLDKSNQNLVFNVNIINGKVFEDVPNLYGEYCFKPVITITGDLVIKSGNGTINSPFFIGK